MRTLMWAGLWWGVTGTVVALGMGAIAKAGMEEPDGPTPPRRDHERLDAVASALVWSHTAYPRRNNHENHR